MKQCGAVSARRLCAEISFAWASITVGLCYTSLELVRILECLLFAILTCISFVSDIMWSNHTHTQDVDSGAFALGLILSQVILPALSLSCMCVGVTHRRVHPLVCCSAKPSHPAFSL